MNGLQSVVGTVCAALLVTVTVTANAELANRLPSKSIEARSAFMMPDGARGGRNTVAAR